MKRARVANSSRWSVTIQMPAEVEAEGLSVVGDFNEWNPAKDPMKRRKDGTWARTLRLGPGTYRYRCVSDRGAWFNDATADGYEPSGLGQDNCLMILEAA